MQMQGEPGGSRVLPSGSQVQIELPYALHSPPPSVQWAPTPFSLPPPNSHSDGTSPKVTSTTTQSRGPPSLLLLPPEHEAPSASAAAPSSSSGERGRRNP